MNGYVIVLESDESSNPASYWAGDAATSELDKSAFFTDITAARQSAGNLQSQYTDKTVRVVKASKGIVIDTPTPLTNVAENL